MGVDKAVFKMAVAHDLGVKMDDLLEAAKKEHGAAEGAVNALKLAAQRLEEFQRVVDKDRDEEKITQEEANVVKKYVNQCGGIVRNMVVGAEVRFFQTQGQIAAHTKAVGEVQRYYEEERRKKEAIEHALSEAPNGEEKPEEVSGDEKRASSRPVGVRPGESLAAQRKAETPVKQSEVASAEEKPKKKRKKKKEE